MNERTTRMEVQWNAQVRVNGRTMATDRRLLPRQRWPARRAMAGAPQHRERYLLDPLQRRPVARPAGSLRHLPDRAPPAPALATRRHLGTRAPGPARAGRPARADRLGTVERRLDF